MIKSAGDAQIAYRNASWFASERPTDTTREYEQLGRIVDKWGTPELTRSDAIETKTLVDEMISMWARDLHNEDQGIGFGLAEALLQALVGAAKANTEINDSAT